MNEDQQPDYRQQLGLKKILYKYENQNQQLRSQIKALNERLQWIINKPKTPQQKPNLNPIQQYQGQLLKLELTKLYKSINHHSEEMKINKDGIDLRHEQKCTELDNKILKEEKQIKELKHKLDKYDKIDQGIKFTQFNKAVQNPIQSKIPSPGAPQLTKFDPSLFLQSNNKTLRNSTIRVQNYLQKLSAIKQQTDAVRKSIKQMQHIRDQNERNLIKKHQYQNDLKGYNKLLQNGGKVQTIPEENLPIKKKGVWGMQNTKDNYDLIKNELDKLKEQKKTVLQTIRNQNIVLGNKLKELINQLQGLDKSVQIPPLPYQKRPLKIPIDLSISTKIESPLLQKKLLQPINQPIENAANQFQRKNDKNFVPKMVRKVEWESTKNNSGIQWYDTQVKSPIIGVNLWFDGYLIGIELLHELGSSGQHLQVMGGRKLIPIQYRLASNDYIENVVVYISQGLIHGMQFLSKNGRQDKFGNISKARKFDFGIKKPQKPVVSFGQFRINSNVSQITKLGFQII